MRQAMMAAIVLPALAACGAADPGAPLTADQAAAIADSVGARVQAMAVAVTAEGPAAWRPYFADTAAFFLAAEGRLVLPSSDSATALIDQLARTTRTIELRFDSGVRVDVLGPGLASVSGPYFERVVFTSGRRVEETGYFTGVMARRAAGWQLLSSHWSVVPPAP